jgi:cell division septation protein DedD
VLESTGLASHTQDDGFREIQLNGKQLVFVFMAFTVVVVVIFLCGVLVGRGVRTARGSEAVATATTGVEEIRSVPGDARPPTVVQPGDDPTKALPPAPPAGDAVRGPELAKAALVKPEATEAPGSPGIPGPPGAVDSKSAVRPKPEATEARVVERVPPKAAATKSVPSGSMAAASKATSVKAAGGLPAADDARQGWVIQVAAVRTRSEADGLAKSLGAKGYTAFVLSGNANVFRVRVGGYKSKRDAEAVAAKLRREERINPWVTR